MAQGRSDGKWERSPKSSGGWKSCPTEGDLKKFNAGWGNALGGGKPWKKTQKVHGFRKGTNEAQKQVVNWEKKAAC